MDLKQIHYILRVAELGNITKAANEFFMTQPALSHYIAKVEKEAGVKLFDRSANPLALTYAGERYVETARRILALNLQLEEELADIAEHRRGRLVIGIPPARASHMLPYLIPRYIRKFPDVEIKTVEHNSRQLKEDVRRGTVDFAVLPLLDGFEEFHCEILFDEELLLVTKAGMLDETYYHSNENGDRVIEFGKLKDEPFVLLKNGHGIRNALDTLFKFHGYEPKIFMETTNNETAFRLATNGLGIAVVPEMNIKTLRFVNPIDIYKISDIGLSWQIAAIFRKDDYVSLLSKECVRLMKEIYTPAEID